MGEKTPHEIIHYATITTTIKSYSTDVYGPQQILRYDEQQSYTHKHTHTHSKHKHKFWQFLFHKLIKKKRVNKQVFGNILQKYKYGCQKE